MTIAPGQTSCAACVADTLDPFSRRYRYPFTLCAECSPLQDGQAMATAPCPPCAACRQEHADPGGRRFRTPASRCHACGPRATLRRLDGRAFSLDALTCLDGLDAAATLIGRGEIVLIKTPAGHQFACDATHPASIARLRQLAPHAAQAFTLMVRELDPLGGAGEPNALAAATMLPPTPLHHLLMRRRKAPVLLASAHQGAATLAGTPRAATARLRAAVNYLLDHGPAPAHANPVPQP